MARSLLDVYKDSIDELFAEVLNLDKGRFKDSLGWPRELVNVTNANGDTVAISTPNETPWMEMMQAFSTVKNLEPCVVDESVSKHARAPLALMLTFHLLEADMWQTTLGNLFKVIINEEPEQTLFRGWTLSNKMCKMNSFMKACERNMRLSIFDHYRKLCSEDIVGLRNAFSHSGYFCTWKGDNEGDISITKYWIGGRPNNPPKQYFTFSEIQEILQRTLTFLTAFTFMRKEVLKNSEAFKGK